MLEDYTIEKIIDEIHFEIDKLSEVINGEYTDKNYLYVMLGKIYGMIHILKMIKKGDK